MKRQLMITFFYVLYIQTNLWYDKYFFENLIDFSRNFILKILLSKIFGKNIKLFYAKNIKLFVK